MLHEETTEKIIQAFYKVNNTLGHGFLEKVYENAMAVELRKMGFTVAQQKKIKVYYEGEEGGNKFHENPLYLYPKLSRIVNDKKSVQIRAIHVIRVQGF